MFFDRFFFYYFSCSLCAYACCCAKLLLVSHTYQIALMSVRWINAWINEWSDMCIDGLTNREHNARFHAIIVQLFTFFQQIAFKFIFFIHNSHKFDNNCRCRSTIHLFNISPIIFVGICGVHTHKMEPSYIDISIWFTKVIKKTIQVINSDRKTEIPNLNWTMDCFIVGQCWNKVRWMDENSKKFRSHRNRKLYKWLLHRKVMAIISVGRAFIEQTEIN